MAALIRRPRLRFRRVRLCSLQRRSANGSSMSPNANFVETRSQNSWPTETGSDSSNPPHCSMTRLWITDAGSWTKMLSNSSAVSRPC